MCQTDPAEVDSCPKKSWKTTTFQSLSLVKTALSLFWIAGGKPKYMRDDLSTALRNSIDTADAKGFFTNMMDAMVGSKT